MATATNYQLVLVGASGRTYSISGYTADTAGVVNTFSADSTAGSGSLNYWRAPENVVLVDFSIPTGTTQTSNVMTQDGVKRAGAFIGFVPHLNTNSNRPKLNIPFPAGSLIGAITN